MELFDFLEAEHAALSHSIIQYGFKGVTAALAEFAAPNTFARSSSPIAVDTYRCRSNQPFGLPNCSPTFLILLLVAWEVFEVVLPAS